MTGTIIPTLLMTSAFLFHFVEASTYGSSSSGVSGSSPPPGGFHTSSLKQIGDIEEGIVFRDMSLGKVDLKKLKKFKNSPLKKIFEDEEAIVYKGTYLGKFSHETLIVTAEADATGFFVYRDSERIHLNPSEWMLEIAGYSNNVHDRDWVYYQALPCYEQLQAERRQREQQRLAQEELELIRREEHPNRGRCIIS